MTGAGWLRRRADETPQGEALAKVIYSHQAIRDLERLIAFALEQPAESSNATVERIAGIPPSLGSDRTTLLA